MKFWTLLIVAVFATSALTACGGSTCEDATEIVEACFEEAGGEVMSDVAACEESDELQSQAECVVDAEGDCAAVTACLLG